MPNETSLKKLVIPAIIHKSKSGIVGADRHVLDEEVFFGVFDPRIHVEIRLQGLIQTGLSRHICLLSQAMTVFGSKRRELPTLNEGRLPSFAAR